MRSPHLAGFQVLDLQDFPGQGTALVGMLNARLENKGLIKPQEWRGFCGDLVPLALFDSYVWECGKKVSVKLAVRSHRAFVRAQKAKVIYSCGQQTQEYVVEIPENVSGYFKLTDIEILPKQEGKATLLFDIPGEEIQNKWELTVFQEEARAIQNGQKTMAQCLEELKMKASSWFENGKERVFLAQSVKDAEAVLQKGGRVLLLTGKLDEERYVRGFYCTDFWNYNMFHSISVAMGKQVPVGTMGICVDKEHPIAKAMYAEGYSTPQWYEPITHCDCMILDNMPAGYRPILQMIDNVDRNHRLGILFEAKVAGGSLLVCTVRFEEMADDLSMQALWRAILDYARSEDFAPTQEASWEQLGL
jgi:hypothetical protein